MYHLLLKLTNKSIGGIAVADDLNLIAQTIEENFDQEQIINIITTNISRSHAEKIARLLRRYFSDACVLDGSIGLRFFPSKTHLSRWLSPENLNLALAEIDHEKHRETIFSIFAVLFTTPSTIPSVDSIVSRANSREIFIKVFKDDKEILEKIDELFEEVEEKIHVNSSSIDWVSYSGKNQSLTVTFNSGSQYRYLGVPKRVFQDLLDSPSKGRFFNSEIKDHYSFDKI